MLFRPDNEGLRKGVYGALNWFFEQEEWGIVLEDDCVPDPAFFPFCSELLIKYQHEEQIMHIGCSNLLATQTMPTGSSYVFSKFSFVWGWASWRRAWQKMEINLDGLGEFERIGGMRRFLSNAMAREYMLEKFRSTRAGRNNSWAYAWFFSILKNNGLCVVSATNLVENTGIGAGATHTTGKNKRAQLRSGPIGFPLAHPGCFAVDTRLEMQFFYTTQKRKYRLWLWYILRRLRLR
ncbi:MAG: hypothetical protein IPM81_15535 [Saprospirales bacterium]|nr:hypothetical protein [Saprospirales bacterium]